MVSSLISNRPIFAEPWLCPLAFRAGPFSRLVAKKRRKRLDHLMPFFHLLQIFHQVLRPVPVKPDLGIAQFARAWGGVLIEMNRPPSWRLLFLKANCGWVHPCNIAVIPAKAGIQGVNGIARFARDLKTYLWVADPRQVAFLCLPKEKRPKERAPRSRRIPLALLAGIGARLTRRARKCMARRASAASRATFSRLGLKHEARFSRFRL